LIELFQQIEFLLLYSGHLEINSIIGEWQQSSEDSYFFLARIISRLPGGPGSFSTENPTLIKVRLKAP
jgi:hypothetical protein